MARRCPACRRLVSPVVLMTMTRRWTFACRHCWATIRATPLSALVAGGAGILAGALIVAICFIKFGRGAGQLIELPVALAFMTSRLLPRFEVEDAALE